MLFEQCDKSSPLNFTQYAVLSHSIEIVTWPQITTTSLQMCMKAKLANTLSDIQQNNTIKCR